MRGAISFCAAAVCIAAIATPSPVAAATPPLEVDDLAQAWRWRTYDRDGRLPAGPVSALGHDRDDMIYVGTDEGLFRYNGYHWTKLASVDPLGSSDLKRIVESGGEIFLVTSRDVWVLRLGVELRRVYQSPSFLIAESPAGEVYVVDLVERTHLKLEKDGPGPVDGGANPVPVPRGEPLDYVVDAGRVHWLATDEGLYQRDFGAGRPWKIDSGLGPQLSGLRCDRLFLVKHQSVRSLPFQIVVSRQLWARFESPRGTPILARREDSGRWAVVSLADPQPSVERLIRDGQGS